MGGDNAPDEIVAGAVRAHAELDVDVVLVGDPHQVEAALKHHTHSSDIEIVPSEGTVEMDVVADEYATLDKLLEAWHDP